MREGGTSDQVSEEVTGSRSEREGGTSDREMSVSTSCFGYCQILKNMHMYSSVSVVLPAPETELPSVLQRKKGNGIAQTRITLKWTTLLPGFL